MKQKIVYYDHVREPIENPGPNDARRILSATLYDEIGVEIKTVSAFYSQFSNSYMRIYPGGLLMLKAQSLLQRLMRNSLGMNSPVSKARIYNAGSRTDAFVGAFNVPPNSSTGRYIRKYLSVMLAEVRAEMRAQGDFATAFDISGFSLRVRGRSPISTGINTTTSRAGTHDLPLENAGRFDVYLVANTRKRYHSVV